MREHLDLLSRADLVTRTSERRTKPGRPRIVYQAAPRNYRSPGAEGYKFLAEILASYIEATVDDPAGAAEEAGRAWGRHLADRPAPFVHLEPSQVVNQITTTLADFGFAPEEAEAGERIVVKLHDCLFREMARDRGDVVCSIHLRILRGMAEELGDSVTVDGLHPFVEPSLCIVQLSTRE